MTRQPEFEGRPAVHPLRAVEGVERLTDEHLSAVKEFVEQLGGIENARRAIAALKELKQAA